MAALVLVLTVGSTGARTLDQVPHYLKKEGNFVSYPAIAVGGIGAVVGGVIALPAALVAAPIGWAAGDPLGYALLPVSLVATAGIEAGYHVGGAVPWVVKNGFYDAPMTGIAKIRGEPASGLVAQVDPPPEKTPADIQYLASTPVEARVPVELPYERSLALPPPKEPTSLMLKRQLSPFKLPPGAAVPAAAATRAALGRPAPVSAPPAPVSAAPVVPPPTPAAESSIGVPAAAAAAVPPTAAAPVRAAPARAAGTPRPAAGSPAPRSEPEPTPAAEAGGPAADDAAEVERPSLKKKKRKFSERFGF